MGNKRSVSNLIASAGGVATLERSAEVPVAEVSAPDAKPWEGNPVLEAVVANIFVSDDPEIRAEHPLLVNPPKNDQNMFRAMMSKQVLPDMATPGLYYVSEKFPGFEQLTAEHGVEAKAPATVETGSLGGTVLHGEEATIREALTGSKSLAQLNGNPKTRPLVMQAVDRGWVDYADDGRGWYFTDAFPRS